MPAMLRVMRDEPPALAPFLSRMTWRYDPYVIDATWSRRDRLWSVKINGQLVDTFPSIARINEFLRWTGDDLRAGTFDAEAWRNAHLDLIVESDDALPPDLKLLKAPPV